MEEYCDTHGIFLDIIPGEAHWKISEPEISLAEALSTAVRTFAEALMKLVESWRPCRRSP